MTAALVLPISGPASGTWNALPLGTLDDNGYELQCTVQGQEINASDAFGMTLVEAIYRGQNWRLNTRGLEWAKTGQLGLLQMFGQTGSTSTLTPETINVGDRWSKYCQSLVLTSILANPPSIPQTLTALLAGLAPQMQASFNLTSKMREMPLSLVLLPYSAGGSVNANTPFTTT
jgi:hypothetical protein